MRNKAFTNCFLPLVPGTTQNLSPSKDIFDEDVWVNWDKASLRTRPQLPEKDTGFENLPGPLILKKPSFP